eukprot:1435520-Alexandrium_andersonii.AAC.1
MRRAAACAISPAPTRKARGAAASGRRTTPARFTRTSASLASRQRAPAPSSAAPGPERMPGASRRTSQSLAERTGRRA